MLSHQRCERRARCTEAQRRSSGTAPANTYVELLPRESGCTTDPNTDEIVVRASRKHLLK